MVPGWWPGGGVIDQPAFYAYAYPEPPGFRTATLLAFLQSTYEAAAIAGAWDRAALERR